MGSSSADFHLSRLPTFRLPSALLCRDQRPAGDGAAHRAPSAKGLVDVGGDLAGLGDFYSVVVDLRVGDVPNAQPPRCIRAEIGAEGPKDGVAHLGLLAQPLELVVVVRRVEPE